ncbi:MAG: hypothetical protein JNL87_21980 [Burkholderiaceae bacterium]|nr:hypothetical protein [Burkholderiaceae bacterium]
MLAAAVAAPAALAAPLDALLTATPERADPRGRVELGFDKAVGALDFSTSSDPSGQTPAITQGDYSGAQMHAAWRATDRLWLSGGLWQRRIHNAVDRFDYRSWQLAGQYRFNDAAGAVPAFALRLSGWGNQASETAATTPVRVPGAVLNTVTVADPADRNLQADLVATWPLSSQLDVTGLLSVGSTKLSYGGLTATTSVAGCNYHLQFTGNDIFGTLIEPCAGSGGAVIRQFYDSSGDYGVDVAREIAWSGRFMQFGANAQWRDGPWSVAGGYLFYTIRRDDVDDILARRGNPVYRHNHQLMFEAAYKLNPNWSPFARAQINSNLFFNDIPVTYNASTSSSFGTALSVVTIGLRGGF